MKMQEHIRPYIVPVHDFVGVGSHKHRHDDVAVRNCLWCDQPVHDRHQWFTHRMHMECELACADYWKQQPISTGRR